MFVSFDALEGCWEHRHGVQGLVFLSLSQMKLQLAALVVPSADQGLQR
jgi:hypothetical protein